MSASRPNGDNLLTRLNGWTEWLVASILMTGTLGLLCSLSIVFGYWAGYGERMGQWATVGPAMSYSTSILFSLAFAGITTTGLLGRRLVSGLGSIVSMLKRQLGSSF